MPRARLELARQYDPSQDFKNCTVTKTSHLYAIWGQKGIDEAPRPGTFRKLYKSALIFFGQQPTIRGMRKTSVSRDQIEVIEWLSAIRWDEGPVCQGCGKVDSSQLIKTRGIFQCRECRVQYGVLSGTRFEGTRLSPSDLKAALEYVFVMLALGPYEYSARKLMRDMNWKSFSTANRFWAKIRPNVEAIWAAQQVDPQAIADWWDTDQVAFKEFVRVILSSR